jgi:hypothetical protein
MAEETVVGFDQRTADRVLKATRSVESMNISPAGSRTKQTFSIEQVIVPRSGPDGDGLYTCDVYIVNDPQTGSYTQVTTGQKARLLPSTL